MGGRCILVSYTAGRYTRVRPGMASGMWKAILEKDHNSLLLFPKAAASPPLHCLWLPSLFFTWNLGLLVVPPPIPFPRVFGGKKRYNKEASWERKVENLQGGFSSYFLSHQQATLSISQSRFHLLGLPLLLFAGLLMQILHGTAKVVIFCIKQSWIPECLIKP